MVVSVDFLLTAFVVALVPGTGVIYTVSNALFGGRRAGILAATGCTFGIVPHLLAATLGLSALLDSSAHVFQTMKLIGVAYLLYMAWGMWRSTGSLAVQRRNPGGSGRAIVTRGAAVNLLNPKLTIFFFAFLPQFTHTGSRTTPQLLLLGVVFMAVTLVVFLLYGLVASSVSERVVNSPTVVQRLQRGFAVTLAGLGFRMALQQR